MNIKEAHKLCKPFCTKDPTRESLTKPWVQVLAGFKCMVAMDGYAIAWVKVDDGSDAPAHLCAYNDDLTPDWSAHPPIAENLFPPMLWGVDVTEAMRAARDVCQGVPAKTLTRKKDPLAIVTSIGESKAILYGAESADDVQQQIPGPCILLTAEYVARLPEIVSATRFGEYYIVMEHGDEFGSLLMAKRGWKTG